MPVLNNARHERFAQEIAKGSNATEAYIKAGFSENGAGVSANRLRKNAKVEARIAELLLTREKIEGLSTAKAIEKAAVSKQWVLDRLRENVERAMQYEAPRDEAGNKTGEFKYEGSVANRALELLGKELGMFIDKKEIRTGALDDVPADTVARVREQLIAERNRRADSEQRPDAQAKPH